MAGRENLENQIIILKKSAMRAFFFFLRFLKTHCLDHTESIQDNSQDVKGGLKPFFLSYDI